MTIADMPEKRKKSKLTRHGDEAKRAAMKTRLLEELEKQDWNLTETARVLEMGANSTVIAALQDLAPKEYAAAKKAGKIRPGYYRRN